CALISMDSTLRSNVSVGLPLDLLVYDSGALAVTHFVTIDERNQYFQMIRSTWGDQLKSVFEGLDNPLWNAAPEATSNVLHSTRSGGKPVRVTPPANVAAPAMSTAPLQTLAQQFHDGQQ
ncbi:MAG: peptidase, partial [Pseudomonadota bacterium]